MVGTSRLLSRNRLGFWDEESREVATRDLPTPSTLEEYVPPVGVNTPFRFAAFVVQLHREKGLEPFPFGSYTRFASKFSNYGYKALCMAAYRAAVFSKYPFSPKFIESQLDVVESDEVIVQQLF